MRIKDVLSNEQLDKLKYEADMLLQGDFIFSNPWDMECCRQPYKLIDHRFHLSPNTDPEWVYQLSRMEYLTKLLVVFRYTNDQKYLQFWREFVEKWFKQNNCKKDKLKEFGSSIWDKVRRRIDNYTNKIVVDSVKYEKKATYRTLDTAIRNCTLLAGILNTPELLNSGEIDWLCERIDRDAEFTIDHLRVFDDTSNWGIIICSNYLSTQLCLKKWKRREFSMQRFREIEQRLLQMLKNQFTEGGAHCEASAMYHAQILICLLRLLLLAKDGEVEINESVRSYGEKAFRYAIELADPNGRQIMYGDSDLTNLATLAVIGASILQHEIPKTFIGQELDPILLYEFGYFNSNEVNLCYSDKAATGLKVFDDGIVRVDWADSLLYLYNTESPSGHKHADNGSIVYYYKGHPYLIDSGRYTYCFEGKRQYYKGHLSHNIVTIDNGINYQFANKWTFKEHAQLAEVDVVENSEVKVISSSYQFLSNQAKISRICVCMPTDMVIIVDYIQCSGEHRGSMELSLDPSIQCTVLGNRVTLHDGENSIFLYSDQHSFEKLPGCVSLNYNEEVPSEKLHYEYGFTDEAVGVTVISDEADLKLEHKNGESLVNTPTQTIAVCRMGQDVVVVIGAQQYRVKINEKKGRS